MASHRTIPLYLTSSYGFDELRPVLRRGDIERLRYGAYVPPVPSEMKRWQVDAAHLEARSRAVASTLSSWFAFTHETAAFIHEWPGPVASHVHIGQRFRSGPGMSADIVRHFCPDIPDEDIIDVKGLPVTGHARTAVDCALAYPPWISLPIVDAALRTMANVSRFERAESITRQEQCRAELLERLARRGPVRHVRRARAVMEHANGFAESGPESWLRWVSLAHGFPIPELQLPVGTARGILYPDLMWPDLGPLMAEYDGMDKYEDDDDDRVGAAIVAQTDREQLLKQATSGDVVRFTRHDKRDDPDKAFRRLLRAVPKAVHLEPRLELMDRRVRL
ncbi:hypothetical protein [Pseudactinotalea terrae]|uniref:hypothetical protein n=1 Tax=Pseudactinotalea terrae TaxID=1743262 RepID=UPI0012E233C7|nr:hypothetical protein [Pseudactinotalea terrae]